MDVSLTDVKKAAADISTALSQGEKLRLSVEAERELGRRDTFYLCRNILGYTRLNNDFHRKLCLFYDKHFYDNQFHLHPRGHFKTTIITIAGNIRLVLLDPNITICIMTNTIENAKKIMRGIKGAFIGNEKFGALYPEHVPQRMRDGGTSLEFTTPARSRPWIRESTIELTSANSAVVSRHYLKMHFDDIVDKDNRTTRELRNQTYQNYALSLSVIDPYDKGRELRRGNPWHHCVGTRWHNDDAWGRILEIEREKEKDKREFKILITSAIRDKNGEREALFPEDFPLDALEAIRAKQGPGDFSCLYMNNPSPTDEMDLDPAYLQMYDQSVKFQRRLDTLTTVDPAGTWGSRDGDPTVISTFSCDGDGNIYVREVLRGWWNPEEIVENILGVHKRFHVRLVGIEAVNFQKWLCFYLEKARREKGLFFKVEPVKRDSHQKKSERQRRCVAPWRTKHIYVRQNEPELEVIVKEAREYPYGRYDDFLDTLADAIELLRPPPKHKEVPRFHHPPVLRNRRNKFQTGYTTFCQ